MANLSGFLFRRVTENVEFKGTIENIYINYYILCT